MGIFSSKLDQKPEFSNIRYNKPYKLTDFFALMLFMYIYIGDFNKDKDQNKIKKHDYISRLDYVHTSFKSYCIHELKCNTNITNEKNTLLKILHDIQNCKITDDNVIKFIYKFDEELKNTDLIIDCTQPRRSIIPEMCYKEVNNHKITLKTSKNMNNIYNQISKLQSFGLIFNDYHINQMIQDKNKDLNKKIVEVITQYKYKNKNKNLGGQSTNIIEAILYRMKNEKLEQQGGKNKSKKTAKPKTKKINQKCRK